MAELGRMLGARGQRAKSPASPLPTSNPFGEREPIRTSPEIDRTQPPPGRPTAVQRLSSIWGTPGLSGSGSNGPKASVSRLQESAVNVSQPGGERCMAKIRDSALFKEQDHTWHSPSPTQLIEKLLCVLMEAPIGTPLPAQYNSHIMHLIEGYRNQLDQLETAHSRIQMLKDSRARWLNSYTKIGAMWDDREKTYKAEIKRLEKLLLAQDPARSMEVVALARSKSLVDRTGSARFQEAVRGLALQLEEDVDEAPRVDGADEATCSPTIRVDDKDELASPLRRLQLPSRFEGRRTALILDNKHDVLMSEHFRRREHATVVGYPPGPAPLANARTRAVNHETFTTQERARMEAQARAHARERESNKRSETVERETSTQPYDTWGGVQQAGFVSHGLRGDARQASEPTSLNNNSGKHKQARYRHRRRAHRAVRGPIDSSTSSASSESSTQGRRSTASGAETMDPGSRTRTTPAGLEQTVSGNGLSYIGGGSARVATIHVTHDSAFPPMEPVRSNSSRAFSFTAGDDAVDPFTPATRAPAETSTVLAISGFSTNMTAPRPRITTATEGGTSPRPSPPATSGFPLQGSSWKL